VADIDEPTRNAPDAGPQRPDELTSEPGQNRPLDDRLFTAEPLRSPEELDQARVKRESAGRLMESGGDPRQAVKLLLESVEIDPEAGALTLLAQLELANPLWRQRALDHLKQAVALDPKHTGAWLSLANYWSLRGQPDKQARCLQKILGYDPHNQDVREALDILAPPPPPPKRR
jgi:tetratricopeptide (TPR) repeat protein